MRFFLCTDYCRSAPAEILTGFSQKFLPDRIQFGAGSFYNIDMAVQTQKETRPVSPPETDETPNIGTEKKAAGKNKEAAPLRPLRIGIAALACIAALAVGRHLRYGTTLFMEHRTMPGYLPIEEYPLNYSDSGEPTQDVRTFHYDLYSIYSERDGYETSRGITYGSTWDEFVEAYGDETIYYIYTHRYKEDGTVDWDTDTPYYSDRYTVREFDRRHVQTGEIDPSEYGIAIEFHAETDGVRLLYSPEDGDRYLKEYRRSHLFRSFPDTRSFTLEFVFRPEIATGKKGLTVDAVYSTFR